MLPEQKDKAYLWDISEACKDIMQFVQHISYADFSSQKLVRYAVERQIMVIGEAANHLSEDFRNSHPEVSWKKIIGMRNILAHDYGEVLAERVWVTAINFIPELSIKVDKYL